VAAERVEAERRALREAVAGLLAGWPTGRRSPGPGIRPDC
jgi:hypothetical protein